MYKNSKFSILLPLLLSVALAVGMLLGLYFGRSGSETMLRGMLRQMAVPDNKLTRTISLIENRYVDSLSMDTLAEHLLPRLMKELDPHSVYLPASTMSRVNEPLEGEFDGIGVIFNMATDTVVVLNVIPHGPSAEVGVRPGDRIMKINDTLVAGQKIDQERIVSRLRGRRGTKVKLSLLRRDISGLVDVEVTRGVIPIKSVEAAYCISPDLGYVKLGQFARTSFVEFHTAVARLKAQGVNKLIFDLRGNTGGFLDQAILIANEFLHKGQLIVYTEDRNHQQMREFANGEGLLQEMDVVVLIDENSASSSEILAGALQDNDRGTIIGRRSFGKGLVQTQVEFGDGSALRLTTARYFTPTGRCIQKPYTMGDEEGYEMEMVDRIRNNELYSIDSVHFADSLKKVTPKGKVVYGGGGIMPDVFIPIDTTDVTRYFIEVVGRNILYRYTMDYADRHRAQLDSVKTLGGLDSLFAADKGMFDDFVRYAARKGVAPRRRDIERSKPLMEAQLKAFIGRNTILEDNAFFANIRPVDNVVMRAVEILNTEKKDDKENS